MPDVPAPESLAAALRAAAALEGGAGASGSTGPTRSTSATSASCPGTPRSAGEPYQRLWIRADGDAARRPAAARLRRHLRVGHVALRHHPRPARRRAGTTRTSWAPAWTTACGSTGPSGPTSGCSTTRTRRSPPRAAASPAASCSTGQGRLCVSLAQEGLVRMRARTGRVTRRFSGCVDRGVVARLGADVELAGPGDLRVLVEHLLPVGQPARGARDGEEDGEHLEREPHGLVDEARVEVDVGVEPARGEVLVVERDLLELERDVEQRVLARSPRRPRRPSA